MMIRLEPRWLNGARVERLWLIDDRSYNRVRARLRAVLAGVGRPVSSSVAAGRR